MLVLLGRRKQRTDSQLLVLLGRRKQRTDSQLLVLLGRRKQRTDWQLLERCAVWGTERRVFTCLSRFVGAINNKNRQGASYLRARALLTSHPAANRTGPGSARSKRQCVERTQRRGASNCAVGVCAWTVSPEPHIQATRVVGCMHANEVGHVMMRTHLWTLRHLADRIHLFPWTRTHTRKPFD
jgi:hypothetical protein